MSPARALAEIGCCIVSGLALGSLALLYLRSSQAALVWIGELIHLIRYGI